MSNVNNALNMSKKNKGKVGITDTNLLVIIAAAILAALYISIYVLDIKVLLQPQSTFTIFDDNAGLIVAACGMTLVMIVGGIDISISGVMCLVCAVDTYFINTVGRDLVIKMLGQGASEFKVSVTVIILSMVVAVLLGAAFGAVQGFLVAYLNIQPFIITMAGLFLAKGLTEALIPVLGQNTAVKNELFKNITTLKDYKIRLPFLENYKFLGFDANGEEVYEFMDITYVKVGTLVAFAIVILIFVLLKWTKMGRNFYAVGGNRQSALMLGINVKKTVFSSHLLCGVLAGIGGYIYFMTVGSANPKFAAAFEMDAIAAAIIGGTLLSGGVGNVIGTFFGLTILRLMVAIINQVGNDIDFIKNLNLSQGDLKNLSVGIMLTIFLVLQSVIMGIRHKKKA